jgi:hypothetical protein
MITAISAYATEGVAVGTCSERWYRHQSLSNLVFGIYIRQWTESWIERSFEHSIKHSTERWIESCAEHFTEH